VKPSIGRIVIYKISGGDADQINQRRRDFDSYRAKHAAARPEPGDHGRTGHVGHIGNQVVQGDEYPAMIVRIFPGNSVGTVNLKVQLDGDDTFWATSRMHGEGLGEWHWPPRVEREVGDRPASSISTAPF
jgi:hypothetical protein